MIMAIFTAEPTTLTIETTETVNLEQMGHQGNLILLAQLTRGMHTSNVGAGVFKVVSKEPVRVVASSASTHIEYTANNKDDTFPDQTILAKWGVDVAVTRKFFLDARSMPPPR